MTVTGSTQRIFIVEDHQTLRENLVLFFSRKEGWEICGAVATGAEALALVPQLLPNIVIVDMALPDIDGIRLVKCLVEQTADIRCLLLSGMSEDHYAELSLQEGAWGYVMKGDSTVVLQAVETVLNGEIYVSERIRRRMQRSSLH
ncbi:MAG: response regulator transcription factor [Caldilineaceae bacterium]|nr:response regulator transcription factor [Caldilineaceae bacterium]